MVHCTPLPKACPSKGRAQAWEMRGQRRVIKPKTTVVLVPSASIGGAVEGIVPNVGRASKQVRKGERFPRAKGKCDHGGITTPPHHQTLLYHVTCILFDDTGCIMYLSHQKLNQVHHILHYARPFFPYTIHMSFFCITCNAGNTI